MDLQHIWRSFNLQDRRTQYLSVAVPLAGLAAVSLARILLYPPQPYKPRIYASPRQTLQSQSQADQEQLSDIPYPPDALPGARDVDTPYGSIRVYEWGPETGRKVVLVHGISTPSIAFARLTSLLVEHGCRVLLFDLFGRGYSDTPDPTVYKQDAPLFTTQILLALNSSPLSWTGSGTRFTLVGYSLGGGIAASFTSYFPDLVEALVLIAPAGLLRAHRIARSSRLLYGNLLPQSLVNYLVRKRLQGGSAEKPESAEKPSIGPGEAVVAEVPDQEHAANAPDSKQSLMANHSRISVAGAVRWQLESHPGFLPAFISSIKYAPIREQHERWGAVGRRCDMIRNGRKSSGTQQGLCGNKVLVLLGIQDAVINADETAEDAIGVLGRENVKVVRLEGGHDVPIVNSKGCADAMFDMWNEE